MNDDTQSTFLRTKTNECRYIYNLVYSLFEGDPWYFCHRLYFSEGATGDIRYFSMWKKSDSLKNYLALLRGDDLSIVTKGRKVRNPETMEEEEEFRLIQLIGKLAEFEKKVTRLPLSEAIQEVYTILKYTSTPYKHGGTRQDLNMIDETTPDLLIMKRLLRTFIKMPPKANNLKATQKEYVSSFAFRWFIISLLKLNLNQNDQAQQLILPETIHLELIKNYPIPAGDWVHAIVPCLD